MQLAARPSLAGTALVLCLSLLLGGCSGGDDPSSDETPPAQTTEDATRFEVDTTATYGRIVGQLRKRHREVLKRKVTDVVEGWFGSAFVGGSYPRKNFRDAFPGFTDGARAEARRDKLLMSNKGIGNRVDEVTIKTSRLRLDVLTTRKTAVGVTAHFVLRFRTHGELSRTVRVAGRLFLTRAGKGWRIFGYDVSRGAHA